MKSHPVTFEDLADWLDGRLSAEALRRVQEHLAAGCADCERDLAWLRRFKEAARAEGPVQPPAGAVARVKASFRARRALPSPTPRAAWWRVPRLAPLLALVLVAACLTLVPTVLARQATVTVANGALVARKGEAGAWQPLAAGTRLAEGDSVLSPGGVAELVLFDGSRLELQPGAEVELTSLRSGLFGIARRVALYQPAGTVRYDVEPLPAYLASFAVASPAARVTVQGTRFVLTATAAETELHVLQGTVTLAGAFDSAVVHGGESAVAPAGARLRIGSRALPTPHAAPSPTAAPPSGPASGSGPGPGGPAGATSTPGPAGPGPATPQGPKQAPSATSPTAGPAGGSGPGPTRAPGPSGSQGAAGPGGRSQASS